MKKTNKKGFTLVELVIVIAVIAILAAVLIPVFANLIEKANVSAALQNARNEYTAYTLAVATKGEVPEKNCAIKSGKYYFEVVEGELNAEPIGSGDEYELTGYEDTDLTAPEGKDLDDCNSDIIIYAKTATSGNESTGG